MTETERLLFERIEELALEVSTWKARAEEAEHDKERALDDAEEAAKRARDHAERLVEVAEERVSRLRAGCRFDTITPKELVELIGSDGYELEDAAILLSHLRQVAPDTPGS